MTGVEPAADRVRELQLLGRTRDGAALVFAADGERFVLRTGAAVLAALGTTVDEDQIATTLSPREIQNRIRHGESAASIAVSSGMSLSPVERYAGPVLDERAHQSRLAASCQVRARTLGELVAAHTLIREPVVTAADGSPDPAAGEPDWDAWLEPPRPGVSADPVWRVSVRWPSGRRASFAWRPATRTLRALDPTARAVIEDEATDLLDAVLRPIRSGGDAPSPPTLVPRPASTPMRGGSRRAEVPSWDEITSGSRPSD